MLVGLGGFGKEHPVPNHDRKLGALPCEPSHPAVHDCNASEFDEAAQFLHTLARLSIVFR